MPLLFEKYSDDYARFRPGYPEDLISSLIQKLRINGSDRILDLACGTGKLAESFQRIADTQVISIDYSLVLLKKNPNLNKINARAEVLPLQANSFNAVLVGQAFHWFDFGRTFEEIHRVLKPGGGFAIIWYRRARPLEGHRLKMDELVTSLNPQHKYVFLDYDWPEILKKRGGFSILPGFHKEYILEYSIPDYIKLQRSKSYIGDALSADQLESFIAEYEKMLIGEFTDGIVKERLEYFYVGAIKT
jgi:ubiquinone/menaquinone biosynthesis C-methylase UbiE